MGPIIGTGYSAATYDFPLFRRAVANFTFAVISSLVASTIYFAIATALMPPLCTAGYGLATLNGEFFFGALYLFTFHHQHGVHRRGDVGYDAVTPCCHPTTNR